MRGTFVIAVACLVAASCGGGGAAASSGGPGAGPVIDHAVAYRLAAQADMVSSTLRAGDGCAARDAAATLAAEADAAIAAGDVPTALQAPLNESVTSLQGRITCKPPKPHPPKPPDHPKHHHHGNGQGDGGD